jgi:hypothetical protein
MGSIRAISALALGKVASSLQAADAEIAEVSQLCFIAIQLDWQNQGHIGRIEKTETPGQHADDLASLPVANDCFPDGGSVGRELCRQ